MGSTRPVREYDRVVGFEVRHITEDLKDTVGDLRVEVTNWHSCWCRAGSCCAGRVLVRSGRWRVASRVGCRGGG